MATLKDVSKETGLSIGTISRVLNSRGYISEETKAKVFQAMKKLNYQPNELARALSKSSSSVIGVIAPSIRHPYFANLVESIEGTAGRAGYQVLLLLSNGKKEKEATLLEQCKKNRVMGIILCSGLFSTSRLKDMDIPVVTIERMREHATASVECDNKQGGKIAAEHLIAKGCKNLLHVAGVQGSTMPADKRSQGFLQVCEKMHVIHHEISFSETMYENMEYHDFFNNLLKTFPQTDGIFCSSDVAAAQFIQVCHSMGIRIPEDIKVIGFDDIPLSRMTSPTLTTIHQPLKEMAEMAFTLLLGAKEGRMGPTSLTLNVTLIQREST
ncbi:LacI family DNA-binding transcriptional regulator [uncultured Sphaerochaeta sp.]|uniref:LacI family DNA-binding transcriptional regulator n=1 Tax=uncultured Sphaerochaeta sp. TaxID=886478 RepID=UPI002A0A10AF|nr:LacI family DNA-binding transcriptional regulator [uncultured Sphaerochaeta sp.]